MLQCLLLTFMLAAATSSSFWSLQTPTRLSSTSPLPLWTASQLELLLPPGVSAAALQSPGPLFPFRATSPAAIDSALNLSSAGLLPLLAAPVQLPVPQLFSSLAEPSSDEPSSSSSRRSSTSTYTYYSAQFAQARSGRVERSVDSPVGQALAEHAAALSSASAGSAALQANLWLASAGSCTPLHYDATANHFSQLLGSKQLLLFPPAAATAARLLPFSSSLQRSALAGLDGSLAAGQQQLGGHEPLSFVLQAGQSLLIPAFWLHHVCSGPGLSASVSVWLETPEQLAGRSLLALPLPFPQHWRARQLVPGCLLLLRLLCSRGGGLGQEGAQPLHAATVAALRSRFTAPLFSSEALAAAERSGEAEAEAEAESAGSARQAGALHPVCGLPVAAVARQLLAQSPSEPGSAELSVTAAGAELTLLAALNSSSSLEPWLAQAQAALAAHSSEAVKALVAANWLESALLRVLRLSSSSSIARMRRLPLVVLHCLEP